MSVKRALTGGLISAIFAVYAVIFVMSLLTVALLEIRQANTVNFNYLVATLEQRDRFNVEFYQQSLDKISKQQQALHALIKSEDCYDLHNIAAPEVQNRGPDDQNSEPKSCNEIKEEIKGHVNDLLKTYDDMLTKSATLLPWYNESIDGIASKTPQIVPVLDFIDSGIFKSWARSPLELFEMYLLVLMGFLGGIINVTRFFIDPATPSPSILEFLYKPALGGVIALGIFVLYRASQLFLGVQTQDGTVTGSSSMFLLAALGLVSGFCASDAVKQIERAAGRLFGGSALVFAYGLEEAITTTGRQNDAECRQCQMGGVDLWQSRNSARDRAADR